MDECLILSLKGRLLEFLVTVIDWIGYIGWMRWIDWIGYIGWIGWIVLIGYIGWIG